MTEDAQNRHEALKGLAIGGGLGAVGGGVTGVGVGAVEDLIGQADDAVYDYLRRKRHNPPMPKAYGRSVIPKRMLQLGAGGALGLGALGVGTGALIAHLRKKDEETKTAMQVSPFELGYRDTLGLMKIAAGPELMVDTRSTWLPPGAAQPAYHVRQGSEAAAHARSMGLGGKQPGLLSKGWGKFRGLPLAAQIGLGVGAAGLLGGAGYLAAKGVKEPHGRFSEQDMKPELQAAAYGQPVYSHNEASYPPYR